MISLNQPAALSRFHRIPMVLILLLCAGLLWGCGAESKAEEDFTLTGGSTPEEPVDGFLKALNQALQDPQIVIPDVRRTWSARLASFFAPGDRDAQQLGMGLMLRNFALNLSTLEESETLIVEIRYEGLRVLSQDQRQARVRVVDGWINLRRVVTTAEGRTVVLRDQGGKLVEVLGMADDGFPVIEQGGRWFLTEWPISSPPPAPAGLSP